MDCYLCKKRGKTWDGANSKCAFEETRFNFDNWNCATMNRLRSIAEKKGLVYRDDLCFGSIGIVPFEGEEAQGYIVITWLKNKGKVGNALVVFGNKPTKELTYNVAIEAIDYYGGAL